MLPTHTIHDVLCVASSSRARGNDKLVLPQLERCHFEHLDLCTLGMLPLPLTGVRSGMSIERHGQR